MNGMRVVGFAVFAALLIGGLVFFMDNKKKQDAQTEANAAKYFLSLMAEDKTVDIPNPQGGAPIHPWSLTSTPTQLEIEDKVPLPRTMDGEWFTWVLHADLKGGTDVKTINVRAKFDNQGNLQTLNGLHGSVGTSSGFWVPE